MMLKIKCNNKNTDNKNISKIIWNLRQCYLFVGILK